MKLTLEQFDEVFTIEVKNECPSASEMVEYIYQLMLGAGYHKQNIDEAFYDKADDLGAEEGYMMQPIADLAKDYTAESDETETETEADNTQADETETEAEAEAEPKKTSMFI